jgi:hypothetical protein
MPRRPRSRAETKQATREALIRAALDEFAEHGLDASLDTICARATLTLGGFVAMLTAGGGALATSRVLDLFFAAAKARDPAVHGGRLRFSHVMDACRRSPQVGAAYRALICDGRDRIAAAIAADQDRGNVRADVAPAALGDFVTIAALGIVAMFELELGFDVTQLRDTARALVLR